jgi:hypothetical protein
MTFRIKWLPLICGHIENRKTASMQIENFLYSLLIFFGTGVGYCQDNKKEPLPYSLFNNLRLL